MSRSLLKRSANARLRSETIGKFEGHRTLQRSVSSFGQPDLTHAASPQFAVQFVRSDDGAWGGQVSVQGRPQGVRRHGQGRHRVEKLIVPGLPPQQLAECRQEIGVFRP
jgi:hypothetical protein